MSIRVIGIGTPHGDDAAGLHVAANLAQGTLPASVGVIACERGADLFDALSASETAVIVDAMRSGGAPGAVRRISIAALPSRSGLSTHGFGVGQALALACALGCAPKHVELIGIEAGDAAYGAISADVEAGIAVASDLVRALLAELTRAES